MAHLTWNTDVVSSICLAAVGAFLALMVLIALTSRLLIPRELELADDAVVFPNLGVQWWMTRIPYEDIIRVRERGGDCFDGAWLFIVTDRGQFEIMASKLPDTESYDAVRDFICSRASITMPRHDQEEPRPEWAWEGFPQPVLSWVEPELWLRYRTSLVVAKPLWLRLAKALRFFACCFGIFCVLWLIVCLFRLPTTPAACYFPGLIAVALFLAWLHWMSATRPVPLTRISFRDHGITRWYGRQSADMCYRDCSGWDVVERQHEGRPLHVMLLRWRTHVIEVAMPDASTRDRVEQILEARGIPHGSDLKPSWE